MQITTVLNTTARGSQRVWKRRMPGYISLGLLLGGASLCAQVRYQVTDLGAMTLGSGAYGTSINNTGQVAVRSNNSAFLYTDCQLINLGSLNSYPDSAAYGVNNAGQVTGDSYVGDGTFHAFLYSNGQMQDLGTLGGAFSEGEGINDAGQVVGIAGTNSSFHAFLYTNGQMMDLGTLGGDASEAKSINNVGQVAGRAQTSDGSFHAFLYSDGQMKDLGTLPGGDFSIGNSVNNAGQVVGYSSTSLAGSHAFLYSKGQMYDLNDLINPALFLTLYQATGINDKGEIVANSPAGRAYLLTPCRSRKHEPCLGQQCEDSKSNACEQSRDPQ